MTDDHELPLFGSIDDLDDARAPHVGRPPLPAGEARTDRTTVRYKPDDFEDVHRAAAKVAHPAGMAGFVRDASIEYARRVLEG